MGNRCKIQVSVNASVLIMLALSLYIIPIRWLLAWYAAVIIHELGHYFAVKLSGGQILSFQIRGNGCRMETTPLSDGKAVLSLVAGPIASLIPLLFIRQVPRLAVCGLFHSVFNLLPIYPLDGGKIVRILTYRKIPCKE